MDIYIIYYIRNKKGMIKMKLSIWVTKECNMRCKYCYENGMDRTFSNSDEELFIDAISEFINVNTKKTGDKKIFIKFFRGEPLIKFEFVSRLVDKLSISLNNKLKIYYSITTNGTLINNNYDRLV